MSTYIPVLPLKTGSAGNVRVDVASDTIGVLVRYIFDTPNGTEDGYLYFAQVKSFSYQHAGQIRDFPSGALDCVCVEDNPNRTAGSPQAFSCFFSEHGLLEVLAQSVSAPESGPPTLTEIFEKMIGSDLT